MKNKYKDVIGSTTINVTVDSYVYNEVVSSGNISQAIRTAVDTWVAEHAPIVPAPYRRNYQQLGAYFTEDDYYTIRAYALARRWSIAKAIRTALYWYYYHRS